MTWLWAEDSLGRPLPVGGRQAPCRAPPAGWATSGLQAPPGPVFARVLTLGLGSALLIY